MKHRAKLALGVVLVLAGGWLAFLIVRRVVFLFAHIVKIWQVGALLALWRLGFFVLMAFLALYLILVGLRMVNLTASRPFRFGWGKILFGAVALYIQLGYDYHFIEGPPSYNPSDTHMAFSLLVWSLICVYLIFRGIWAGFSQRERQPNIQASRSDESGR